MNSCALWVGGILSHAAALQNRAGKGKMSFNPHLCCVLRNCFSSPTLLAELVQTRFCFQGGNSCLMSLVVPLEPSHSQAFSRDHPGAQHVPLVPQLLEIFLCLEQGPEARVCLQFFPLSLVNLGKDTFKASLICCSLPVFPTEPGSGTMPRSKRWI